MSSNHQMNAEQLAVLEAVKAGNNVFMYGAGGVGKSYCIQHVQAWAHASQKNIAITATTGAAAFLIKGMTIHSYLGIGVPGTKSVVDVAGYVMKRRKDVVKRVRNLDILVIDEISMLDADLFDFIIAFLSIVRGVDANRVQLLLSGDLHQLPPCKGSYMFDAASWNSDIQTIELTHSHRHSGDEEFGRILRELRVGECSAESLDLLRATASNKMKDATYLFARNASVDSINEERFAKLVDKTNIARKIYINKNTSGAFAKQGRVPDTVELCVGALVMLTWNVDLESGLCNGAKGTVEATEADRVLVKFRGDRSVWIAYVKVISEDDKNDWVEFMPLRLAYAITVNKSQGATLDRVVVVFEENDVHSHGRAYTALSRVRTLQDLSVRGNIGGHMFRPHPDVVRFLSCSV